MEYDPNINVARNARILIVDDQSISIGAVSDLLARAGYAVLISITDPAEALAKVPQLQPDLLILDWHMCPISGLDFIEGLKAATAPEAMPPILVITADGTAETRREALAVGASDFMEKPLDSSETLLRIRNLLRARYLQRRLDTERRTTADELAAAKAELAELRPGPAAPAA